MMSQFHCFASCHVLTLRLDSILFTLSVDLWRTSTSNQTQSAAALANHDDLCYHDDQVISSPGQKGKAFPQDRRDRQFLQLHHENCYIHLWVSTTNLT